MKIQIWSLKNKKNLEKDRKSEIQKNFIMAAQAASVFDSIEHNTQELVEELYRQQKPNLLVYEDYYSSSEPEDLEREAPPEREAPKDRPQFTVASLTRDLTDIGVLPKTTSCKGRSEIPSNGVEFLGPQVHQSYRASAYNDISTPDEINKFQNFISGKTDPTGQPRSARPKKIPNTSGVMIGGSGAVLIEDAEHPRSIASDGRGVVTVSEASGLVPINPRALGDAHMTSEPIDTTVLAKKQIESLWSKNYARNLDTVLKYYAQTGQLLMGGIPEILLKQALETQELDEGIDRLEGKVPPKDIVAFWITLNPITDDRDPYDVLEELREDIDKIKSKYITHKEWVFENRADNPDQVGRGIHAHVLAYTALRRPEEFKKFATSVSYFEKTVLKKLRGRTYSVRCDVKSVVPRRKYLRGQKNRSKSHRVELDRDFRKIFGLEDLYSDEKIKSKN